MSLSVTNTNLQVQCDLGQRQLMEMAYLEAATTLAMAEQDAFANRDFDTLARLYLPLQEARRQIRQRCGEGIVCLDLVAMGPDDHITPEHVIGNFPHGQFVVAGWGSIEPAINVRKLALRHQLFVETFLAAAYPVGASRAVVIVPTEDVSLPSAMPVATIDQLLPQLPPHCLVMHVNELPTGSQRGTPRTYGNVMAMWERLHAPFLAAADSEPDGVGKIQGYRKTIRVDSACELAHQKLATVARSLVARSLSHPKL